MIDTLCMECIVLHSGFNNPIRFPRSEKGAALVYGLCFILQLSLIHLIIFSYPGQPFEIHTDPYLCV